MRQRSRAFIIAEEADPTNRVLFINAGESLTRQLLYRSLDPCSSTFHSLFPTEILE